MRPERSDRRFVVILLAPPLVILLINAIHHQWALLQHLLYISLIAALYFLSFYGWGRAMMGIFPRQRDNGEVPGFVLLGACIVCGAAFEYAVFFLLACSGTFRPLPVILLVVIGSSLALVFASRQPRLTK